MESRLLLSGNEVSSGDFDSSIWQIPSPGSNYYVIPSGDTAGPPTTATDNSPPQTHHLADDTGADYLFIYDQFAITPSLDAALVSRNNPPATMASIQGNGDTHVTLDFDLNVNVIAGGGNSLGASGTSGFGRVVLYDSIHDAGSILLKLQSELGPRLDALDADAPTLAWGETVSVIGSPLTNDSAITPIVKLIVVHSSDSAGVGNSFTAEFVALAPTIDSPTVDSNIAAAKVEPPLESNVDKPVSGSHVVGHHVVGNHVDAGQGAAAAPSREVAAILPARQPAKDEQLADAIDDLLSDDTIIVSPSGQSGSEFVVDGTPSDASSDLAANGQPEGGAALGEASDQQVADGGMIPLDVIVAVTTDSSTTVAAPETQFALDESSDVVGELSRIAVMELIEGEAEPGAPQTADRVAVLAKDDTSDPLEVVQAMTRRAGVAIAMAAPASPAYLARIAGAAVDAASRAMASFVGANLAAEATADAAPADDARSEAFSQLGADEDDELADADAGSVHWNNWLAAAPLIVALACERAIASRKNRQQRDALRPPLTAK